MSAARDLPSIVTMANDTGQRYFTGNMLVSMSLT